MKKIYTLFASFLFLSPLNLLQAQNNQTLYGWGYNYTGQLGNGGLPSEYKPMESDTTTGWELVSAGGNHTIALKKDGSLWGWGENNHGQLGSDDKGYRSIPIQIGSDKDWAFVVAGGAHSLAIKKDGSLWAWGINDNGQLGDGTNIERTMPVQIGVDKDWVSVSGAWYHTVAIKENGTLWAWGNNEDGQLGDATNVNRNSPVQIGLETDWVSASAGGSRTLAIKTDNSLWGWGENTESSLGDGTNMDRNAPVQIGVGKDWASVSAGWWHTLAIKENGTLWAWGFNGSGALGDGTTADRRVPVQIGTADDWFAVSAGGYHTLALKADSSLWAWGDNYYGQLGDGTGSPKYAPVQVGSFTSWLAVSAGGFNYSLAIFNDNITIRPLLQSPGQGGYSSKDLLVQFTLPEKAKEGTVQVTFSQNEAESDQNAPHTVIFSSAFELAAQHALMLDGSKLGATSGVSAVSSAPNDALVDGAVYTVSLTYQDRYGNAVGADTIRSFTYDYTSPVLRMKEASIQLNEVGTATLASADIDAGTSDNVTAPEELVFFLSQTVFNSADVGGKKVEVTVTDQAGNSSSGEVLVEVVDPTVTGLVREKVLPLLIYPNPTKGIIGIRLEDEMPGEKVGIILLNLQGKILLQEEGSLASRVERVNAYLEQAKAGVYLLQLQRNNKTERVKVIKE